jgi:hypothetical protein
MTRDEILAAARAARRRIALDVPAWQTKLTLQELSGLDRARWSEATQEYQKQGVVGQIKSMSFMVCLSVVDADGKRVFSDEDVEALAEASNVEAVKTIAMELLGLNAITQEAADEIEKN